MKKETFILEYDNGNDPTRWEKIGEFPSLEKILTYIKSNHKNVYYFRYWLDGVYTMVDFGEHIKFYRFYKK